MDLYTDVPNVVVMGVWVFVLMATSPHMKTKFAIVANSNVGQYEVVNAR